MSKCRTQFSLTRVPSITGRAAKNRIPVILRMRKLLALLALVPLCCSGCFLSVAHDIEVHRDKKNIRQNILITGQQRSVFHKVWGAPTKTYSRTFTKQGPEGQPREIVPPTGIQEEKLGARVGSGKKSGKAKGRSI